ncbi:hypothetical protein M0802_013501 [Mischocyttarus mexicanus]|nr:hypothetical protein M0802_013501 [Mischocyttarus mexicanus]
MTEATMASKAVTRAGLHATAVESPDILEGIARQGRSSITNGRRQNTLLRDNQLNMDPLKQAIKPDLKGNANPQGQVATNV